MNHIGNIINKYRCDLGTSRNKLCENICSDKYLYLIEKGERTPSADIARLFADKLGIDLFDYYQYLDCENPIMVCEIMKIFKMGRRTNNYKVLKQATDKAIILPDFTKKPWVYEIEVNKCAAPNFRSSMNVSIS